MTTGKLRDRVAFDRPVNSPDGRGGIETTWSAPETAAAVWAEFRYLRGGESVEAARLQGRSVLKVKLHSSPFTRSITSDFRMRDLVRSTVYNVREVDSVSDRRWVWLVVESGVAV